MRSGKLRTKAAIQRASHVANDYGEMIDTWATYAHEWIEIVNSTSREFVQVAQVQAETTHVIRMRFNTRIATKDRIVYTDRGTSRTLNILGIVNQNNANRELLINAAEVSDG